jgi:uncharacterized membrane protein
MLLDAFRSQRQLAARNRPLRAPIHKLNVPAKIAIGIALIVELLCVLGAGSARAAAGVIACAVLLVLAHMAIYAIESRPASLKSRPPGGA